MPLSDANEGISDECLMDAIVRGESAAMEMLYRRYRRLFFCMAYRSTSNKQTAEDLIQVAFLTIWQHRTVYTKELGSARSWLLSIMRHRILDEGRRWRSRSAWKKVPWEEMEESALLLAPDPWEQAWHREQGRHAECCVQVERNNRSPKSSGSGGGQKRSQKAPSNPAWEAGERASFFLCYRFRKLFPLRGYETGMRGKWIACIAAHTIVRQLVSVVKASI